LFEKLFKKYKTLLLKAINYFKAKIYKKIHNQIKSEDEIIRSRLIKKKYKIQIYKKAILIFVDYIILV